MRLERRLGYEVEGLRLHSGVQTPPSANFFGLVWSGSFTSACGQVEVVGW